MTAHLMTLIFNQNITNTIIPPVDDKDLRKFLSLHNFQKPIEIKITPKPLCKINDCHNNVIKYISKYGGERVIGYYILKEEGKNNFVGVTHSVVKKGEKYIDITPTTHSECNNVFIPTNDSELSVSRFEYYDNHLSYEYYQMQSNP